MLKKPYLEGTEKAPTVRKFLKPVARSRANMEAEKGETVLLEDKLGNPAHYRVGGKRHAEGGTPLNLPPESFIYSDTKDMRIKDKQLLEEFGVSGKKPRTPAHIARRYDINKFREVLADPIADKLQKETAVRMIANYEQKLAKLALVQEAMKGFPKGIPKVAQEYVGEMSQGPMDQGNQGEYQMGGAMDDTPMTNDNQLIGAINQTPRWIPQENQNVQAPCTEEQMMDPTSPCYNPTGVTKTTVDSKYGTAYGGPQTAGAILAGMDMITGAIETGNQRKQLPQLRRMLSSTYQYPTKTRSDRGNYDSNSGNFKEYLYGYQPNINRKGGQVYEHGGEVEVYQDGGEVPITLERKPDQTDEQFEAYWKGYAKSHPNERITVRNGDVVKVVAPKRLDPLTDAEKYSGEKIAPNLRDSYGYVNRVLSDPELQAAWYEKWKKNIEASTVPQVVAQRDKILKKYDSPAKVKDLFMKTQEQVYAVRSTPAVFDKLGTTEGTKWDRGYGRNKMYRETMGTLGLDALPEEDIAAFQAGYYGLVDLQDEGHPSVARLNIRARGKDDDTGRRGTKPISRVDAIMGNTSIGQMVTPGDAEFELADIPATPEVPAPEEMVLQPPALEPPVVDDTDEGFFLQDVVGLGANLMDYSGIRKRLPWRNRVQPYLPQPVPYSPQSEIAANLAGGSEIISGLSAYAGPQSLSARSSAVQGQLAQANAQVLGKYSNLNVGVFNQFEGQKADILNNAAFYNADSMMKAYDDTVLSNERYDQDKRTARSAVMSRIASMYGNRADAHNLNMVNPHYQIDPTRAGSMYFKRGSKMVPGKVDPSNPIELYDQYRTDPQYSHIPDDVLLKLISGK
jgi:hypothetical protein